MFKKLDLDIDSILKKSIESARKQNASLNEAVTPVTQLPASSPSSASDAFIEPFDPEKHLSWLKLRPGNWGKKGTVDAQELDAVLEGILGGPTPKGIQGFKQTLSNVNKFLGKKPGEFKLPVGSEGGISPSVRSVFASLELNNILHSIIHTQDPSVAGKMFEGLVARMVGGMKPSKRDAIEDLVDDQGNLISLKLIDDVASTIEGSRLNLAIGIAQASQANPDAGVIYLVCAKDQNENPFRFKTFSFLINRKNYFNFILKKGSKSSDLSLEDIQSVIKSLTGVQKLAKGETFNPFKMPSPDKAYAESLDKYAVSKGANSGNRKSINAKIREIVAANNAKIEDVKKINPRLYDEYFKGLIMTAEGESGKAIQTSEFTRAKETMLNLINLAKDESKKMDLFETDPNIIANIENAKLSGDINALEKIRTDRRTFYNNSYNKLLQASVGARTFIDDIQKIMEETNADFKQSYAQKGKEFSAKISSDKNMMNVIDNFFNTVQTAGSAVGETQFKISTDQARELALVTDANFDDSYEEFIVDSGFLFNGAERSTELLREWIIPIAEKYHNIENFFKRYYIKDEPAAIGEASKETEKLKQAIDSHIAEKEKIGKDISPSQIGENVKKDLTDDFSASILEWVRNLK